MKAFDFKESNHLPQMIEPISKLLVSKILPDNCVVLDNTPVVFRAGSWTNAHRKLQMLKDQGVTGKIVFINGTHDPITYSNRELHEQLDTIKNYFPTSKIVLLSSRVQHWFDNIPEFIYVPYPLQLGYIHHTFKPRQKRIGCLNRNNTAHRVWLMHNLLKQNLLRSDCDVYSMSFEHIHNKNYTRFTKRYVNH